MMQVVHKEKYTVGFYLPPGGEELNLRLEMFGDFLSRGNCRLEQTSPFFVIHMVYAGSGILEIDQKTYEIKPGDVFVFFPGMHIRYGDAEGAPWSYSWISFSGNDGLGIMKMLGITPEQPHLPGLASFLMTIADTYRQEIQTRHLNEFENLAFFYRIMAAIKNARETVPAKTPGDSLAAKIRRYLDHGFWRNLSVKELSDIFGVDRSTLTRNFTSRYGTTIHKYLEKARLEKAVELLCESNSTVEEIAEQCEYKSYRYFCTAFKRRYRKTPSQYRVDARNPPQDNPE